MPDHTPRPYHWTLRALRRVAVWLFALVIAFLGPALSDQFHPWPWTWAIALNAEGMFRDLLLGAIAMGTLCIADLLLGIVLPSDRQPRHQASSLTLTVIVAIRWGQFSGKHLDTDTVSHHVYAILALLGVGALAEVLVGVQE